MDRAYISLVLTLFFVLLGSGGNAQTLDAFYDVRSVNWGMSREEILDREDSLLQASADEWLLYMDVLLGAPAFVTYNFKEGRLYKVMVSLYPENEEQARDLTLGLSGKLNSFYRCKYPEQRPEALHHGGVFLNDRTQVVLVNDYPSGKVVSVSYIALDSEYPPDNLQAEWVKMSKDLDQF